MSEESKGTRRYKHWVHKTGKTDKQNKTDRELKRCQGQRPKNTQWSTNTTQTTKD